MSRGMAVKHQAICTVWTCMYFRCRLLSVFCWGSLHRLPQLRTAMDTSPFLYLWQAQKDAAYSRVRRPLVVGLPLNSPRVFSVMPSAVFTKFSNAAVETLVCAASACMLYTGKILMIKKTTGIFLRISFIICFKMIPRAKFTAKLFWLRRKAY